MRALMVALCASGAGCTPAPPGVAAPAADSEPTQSCALTVRFGSYAMGIDAGTAAQIEQLLRRDPAVTRVDRRPWGREGEFDLCAQVAKAGEAARLFERIGSMLPAKPRGPITVTLGDGRSIQAPPA